MNGKRNGKGKEYNKEGELVYEGEYLDGKRHGKGIEFNHLKVGNNSNYAENKKNIIFEGEYYLDFRLKGKKYIRGLLEYEGEYLFNKKYNGIGYDAKGNAMYEIKNGAGKIKEFDDNFKLIFEGEYLNGKRNGKGKEFDQNGKVIYEGKFLNNERTSDCLIF